MTTPTPTASSKKMLLLFHLLLLIYPILYFMSQNIAEFTLSTYLYTLINVCFFAILVIFAYIFVLKYEKKWLHIIYIALLSFGIYIVLRITVSRIYPLTAIPGSFTLLVFSYFLYYANRLKPATIICGLMALFSIISYTFQIFFFSELNMPKKYPELKIKPNIYFIILESYHGNEALKKIYNYDNSSFLNYLTDQGFTIYPNIYSTRPLTRLSLLSLLTLSNAPDTNKKEHLLNPCLVGKIPCYVMSSLKHNGYTIKTKFANNYLIQNHLKKKNNKSKLLCDTMFADCYQKIYSDCFINNNTKYKVVDDFNLEVINTITDLDTQDSPYIFITKIGGITETQSTYEGGLAHIPNGYLHCNKTHLFPKFKNRYLNELHKENNFLTKMISLIIKKDPNALIIMFGDHGAHLYEILDNREARQAYGITDDDYILDLFNVLVAVRYPNGLKSTKEWHYLPELFSIIFNTLGSPLDNIDIPPICYDYKSKPYHLNKIDF